MIKKSNPGRPTAAHQSHGHATGPTDRLLQVALAGKGNNDIAFKVFVAYPGTGGPVVRKRSTTDGAR